MTHAEIYVLLEFYRKKLNLSDETLARHLTERTSKPINPANLTGFRYGNQPSTKQAVHALLDYGISQKEIGEFLDLAQATVSYHANTDLPKPYKNRWWYDNIDNPSNPGPGNIINGSKEFGTPDRIGSSGEN